MNAAEAFDELCAYTLTLADPEFIHQQVVDAYAEQTATDRDRPIKVAFALVGLCLHLEMGFTGKQVQRAHMRLAARSKSWPTFPLPPTRGAVTVLDALAAAPGAERTAAIRNWCQSVWDAHAANHEAVRRLLRQHLDSPRS
ncbi:MAG TPA: DUF5946 family protein [Opitutaceae bacterium]|nr:DUF5946 family protein [Opitutaceae bacterium]HND60748.1 DUF5946 family protein [Opitutaceae bacterium]